MNNQNIYLFLTASFLLVGVSLVFLQLYFIFKSLNAKNWAYIEGRITHSSIEVIKGIPNKRLETTYKASISYSYMIDGKEYTSGKIFFGDNITRFYSFQAKRLTNKYFPGKTVNVFYNPMNKSQALLEPGLKTGYVFYLLVGLAIMYLGQLFLKTYLSMSNPM